MKKFKSTVILIAIGIFLCNWASFGFSGCVFNMDKICGIYKITSPSEKVYIGQSCNIEKRKYYYSNGHCKGQTKLYASFQKHGWENHKFEILQICNREQLNELEVYYINFYQSFNTLNGMNLQSGGEVVKDSDETRAKKSKALKHRVFTQEWKDKIGAKSKGRMLGFKFSTESRKKLSESRKGIKSKYPNKFKGTGMSKEEQL